MRELLKIGIVSLSLLLAGCSTPGTGADATSAGGADGADGSGKTVSTGLGGDEDLGGAGGNANRMKVGNQTYYFDFDRSDVRDSDRASIQVQARYLAAHPNAKVLLEGNTDPRGSREYNIALGERRGNAVADVLKLAGVEKSQIRVVSYGAEKLASQGHSDEDYQQDRRVNLVYESK